jgi:hypothetical protein
MPCELCDPCGGPDEPPDLSRTRIRVALDRKHGPWH